eukprot:TRINITY_DN885_c0_g1_i2.p1 TRINITY_DN885_c0_g1~~TRINITY_DN885_c0_g1_i2.p1  ORF type:complete len:482 (+),score=134.67 TRINITY_DN885_c0_g1_i2:110-1555(+)
MQAIEIIDDGVSSVTNGTNNSEVQDIDILNSTPKQQSEEEILPLKERNIIPVSLPIQEINQAILTYLQCLNPNINQQDILEHPLAIDDPSVQKAARLFLFKSKRTFDKVYGPFKKSSVSNKAAEDIDPSMVQVIATNDELKSRISKFTSTKRSQIDESNVREFTTDIGDTMSARTNPRQLRKRQQMKQSINEEYLEGTNPKDSDHNNNNNNINNSVFAVVPPGVEERLSAIETHLNIPLFPPTPNEVFRRIKNIEDKILALETVINTPLSTINFIPSLSTTHTPPHNIPSPANLSNSTIIESETVSSPKPPKKLKKSVDDTPKTPQTKPSVKQKKTPKQTSSPVTTSTTPSNTSPIPINPLSPTHLPTHLSLSGNIGITKPHMRKEAPKVSGRGAGKTVKNIHPQNTLNNNNNNNVGSMQVTHTTITPPLPMEYQPQPLGYDFSSTNISNTPVLYPLSDNCNVSIVDPEKRINELLEKLRK